MRFILALALVLLARGTTHGLLVVPEHPPIAVHYANRVSKFFEANGCTTLAPCGRRDWVLSFTAEQVRWLRFFRIEHTAPKFISNTVAESWYNPDAKGADGEAGATQVYSLELADSVLKARGIDPGRLGRTQRQAARGVAVYWHKLQQTDGEPWDAVERYNGGGPGAKRHRNKVWRLHREIFG